MLTARTHLLFFDVVAKVRFPARAIHLMLKPRSVAKTHIHTPTQRPDFHTHTPDNYDDVFLFLGGRRGVVVVCGVWCVVCVCVVCGVWCVVCGVWVWVWVVVCVCCVFVFVFAFAFVSGIVTLLHDDSRPCCVREPRGWCPTPHGYDRMWQSRANVGTGEGAG